jgi:hypothetical protein
MPKEFDDCVKRGGKIHTETLANDKYQHVCVIGGKFFYGEVKTKKKEEGKRDE